MELSYEEVDSYLLKVFTGKEIVNITKGSEEVYLIFKQPTSEIRLRATLVYERSYKQAINEGLYSITELEKLLSERGLYTEEDITKVAKLKSQLEAQEALLSKTTKVKANADRIKKLINKIKDQINEIEYKKNSRLIMSAETKADEERHHYLCWACAYTEQGDKHYWDNVDSLVLEKNINFKIKVMNAFLHFYHGIPMKTIRFIARHNLWRIRYVHSQKVTESLFGIPTVEYSNDQLNLIYWSSYYSNIYEMMPEDRPPDSIIEDDDALDAYMTDYYNERTKENAAKKSNKFNKGKMSAFSKEEVIITQSNDLYQDIKYDKPKEAQKIKDRTDIKKRTRRS
ncbi:MAG TPA: hypothetical protein VI911_07985 [Patescibacteria group bacterium]|nr:hypothetical protein [Patescibacteria group bacterium]